MPMFRFDVGKGKALKIAANGEAATQPWQQRRPWQLWPGWWRLRVKARFPELKTGYPKSSAVFTVNSLDFPSCLSGENAWWSLVVVCEHCAPSLQTQISRNTASNVLLILNTNTAPY